MVRHARRRAERRGLPFDLAEADFFIPAFCPVLGIPLQRLVGGKTGNDNSPSLDRIDPAKGYVAGNVIVVSNRANRIRNDATVSELQQVAHFYERLIHEKGALQTSGVHRRRRKA
jgi:hypothetical protein